MASLPLYKTSDSAAESIPPSHGCGTTCGAGLEKIYPATAVRYGAMAMIGEFKYKPGTVFKCGAKVVIQTDRGLELGQQVSLSCTGCDKHVSREQIKAYIDNSGPEFYRLNSGRILREAGSQDINEHDRLNARIREDIDECQLLAAQLDLDMKVITAEHLLGGERIVFYFRSESRVDFRQLVRELAQRFQTRIEMRQVGARDEARLVADYEVCGRECCCKNFLKKLRPINMKMAKMQKSTLDPSKVSGRCGRLRCCLRYEHEGYEELARKLPRIASRVDTEFGQATVVDRQILTQLVLVRTDDGREITVPLEEIKAFNLPRPPGGTTPAGPADPAGDVRAPGANSGRPRRGGGPRRRETGAHRPSAGGTEEDLRNAAAGPAAEAGDPGGRFVADEDGASTGPPAPPADDPADGPADAAPPSPPAAGENAEAAGPEAPDTDAGRQPGRRRRRRRRGRPGRDASQS